MSTPISGETKSKPFRWNALMESFLSPRIFLAVDGYVDGEPLRGHRQRNQHLLSTFAFPFVWPEASAAHRALTGMYTSCKKLEIDRI
jgi:hypothetical protein